MGGGEERRRVGGEEGGGDEGRRGGGEEGRRGGGEGARRRGGEEARRREEKRVEGRGKREAKGTGRKRDGEDIYRIDLSLSILHSSTLLANCNSNNARARAVAMTSSNHFFPSLSFAKHASSCSRVTFAMASSVSVRVQLPDAYKEVNR